MPVRMPWITRLVASEIFDDVAGRQRQHHHHRGGEADQAQRLQADRLAVQIAVKPDQAAGQRGDAQTQHDLGPVEHVDFSVSADRYFGSRPIR